MSKVILQGHILVPDNDLEAVTQALVVHKELTLEEPGCVVFRVSQSTLQPNRFEVYEEFISREAFETHQQRVKASEWGEISPERDASLPSHRYSDIIMIHSLANRIVTLVKQDPLRVQVLDFVSQLDLPQCYVAAGFVRNLVWDHLHGYASPTPLNDIDVIYFDTIDTSYESDLRYEALLKQRLPELNWQVRNQACMHTRNGDEPYQGSLDAMSYWPEKETAVAVKQSLNGDIECISSFGLESLFDLKITPNPNRSRDVFDQRVQSKNWLSHWPKLTIGNS